MKLHGNGTRWLILALSPITCFMFTEFWGRNTSKTSVIWCCFTGRASIFKIWQIQSAAWKPPERYVLGMAACCRQCHRVCEVYVIWLLDLISVLAEVQRQYTKILYNNLEIFWSTGNMGQGKTPQPFLMQKPFLDLTFLTC